MARLTAHHWTDAALQALGEQGPRALSVEPLARRLGVTKGSFYHHFPNRSALKQAVLERFVARSTEDIITQTNTAETAPWKRLRVLMHTVFAPAPAHERIEAALRAWAATDPQVATTLRHIDTRRVTYVAQLLEEAGHPPPIAHARAALVYRVLIGEVTWAAMGGPRLTPLDLEQLATMLGAPSPRTGE